MWTAVFWGAVMGIAVAAGLTGISGFGIVTLAAFGIVAGVIHARLLTS